MLRAAVTRRVDRGLERNSNKRAARLRLGHRTPLHTDLRKSRSLDNYEAAKANSFRRHLQLQCSDGVALLVVGINRARARLSTGAAMNLKLALFMKSPVWSPTSTALRMWLAHESAIIVFERDRSRRVFRFIVLGFIPLSFFETPRPFHSVQVCTIAAQTSPSQAVPWPTSLRACSWATK